MKRTSAFLFFLLILLVGFDSQAQLLKPGEWKTYTAMNNVQDVALSSDSLSVWAATAGGAYKVQLNDPKQDNIISLRTTDGLSDIDITAVASDADGNIYFGGGIGSFDIYSEKTRSIRNIRDIMLSPLVTKKNIYAINVSGQKAFLCAGYGVSIFNRSSSTFNETVTKFGDRPSEDTAFAAIEANGKIYVALSGSIAIADANSPNLSAPFAWQIVNAPSGAVLRSLAFFQNKVVAGGLGGIFVLDESSSTILAITTPDTINCLKFVLRADLEILDANRGGRIARTSDLSSFTFDPISKSSSQSTPTSYAASPAGKQVFGFLSGGVTASSQSGTPVFDLYPAGPITNNPSYLYFSRTEQKLFVVYGTDGMSRFKPENSAWNNYGTINNSPLPRLDYRKAFYDTSRSVLWLSGGGGGGGMMKVTFNGDAISYNMRSLSAGIPSSNSGGTDFIVPGQCMLDNKGNLACAIWAYHGEALSRSSDGNSFTNTQIVSDIHPFNSIAQDLDGYYFLATCFFTLPPPIGVAYLAPDGSTGLLAGGANGILSSESVNSLVVDQDNGLWCGSNDGVDIVSHFRNGRTGAVEFHVRKVPFLDQQVVKTIAVDGVGNKWVGTDNGIFVVSPDGADSLGHYTSSNSLLLDNSINSISIDQLNCEVYIATVKGISRTSCIFREGSPDYSKMFVYPNPVVQSPLDEPVVTITGLVDGSTVKIFTISGRLVKTIDGTAYGATVTWNGKDDNGKQLASGVYLVSATSALAKESGQSKFVLIRKN
jgi:hypothetical protein